jgi:hypothetical protein
VPRYSVIDVPEIGLRPTRVQSLPGARMWWMVELQLKEYKKYWLLRTTLGILSRALLLSVMISAIIFLGLLNSAFYFTDAFVFRD